VAIRAANVVLQVRGSPKVAVLLAVLMASQAPIADLFRRSVFKGKNFRFVSAAIDMFLARPVASFASVPFRALLRVHGRGKVWRSFVVFNEVLVRHVGMAGFAGLFPDILGGINGSSRNGLHWLLPSFGCLRLRAEGTHGG